MQHLQHIFLTVRSQPMPRWLEAFPDAKVMRPDGVAPLTVALPGEPFFWLHLNQGVGEPGEQTHRVVQSVPRSPVVVLSNVPSEEEGLACIGAGASGYVSSLAAPHVLQQVAAAVQSGGLWVGPELAPRFRRALAIHQPRVDGTGRLDGLSPREREVALAVAAGSSNKEIARLMGITERTVKAHLTAIFERLNIRDRLQLAIMVNADDILAESKTVH